MANIAVAAHETSETVYQLLSNIDPTITAAALTVLGTLAVAYISNRRGYRNGIRRAHADMRLQEFTTIINELSERIVKVRNILAEYAFDKDNGELLDEFGIARFHFFSYYANKHVQLGDIYDKLERLHKLFQYKGGAITLHKEREGAARIKAAKDADAMEDKIDPLVREIMIDLETRRGVWIEKDNFFKRAVRWLWNYLFPAA